MNHGDVFQLRGFPASITSKAMLVDIVTRLIWTSTAQHTAVNYPITAYGAFTPNMPTKMYDDDRVAPEVFNPLRLPNAFLSAVSRMLINKITALTLAIKKKNKNKTWKEENESQTNKPNECFS